MQELESAAAQATTRRRFVSTLGKTLALGLGISLFGARAARANPQAESHCCQQNCGNCGSNVPYWCTGGCVSCCACFAPGTAKCVDFSGGCLC